MLYYFPERIYNLVKDTEEMQLINEKISESFNGVRTLVDAIAWEEKINKDFTRFTLDEINLMMDKYIPENMWVEALVCADTSYNKEKLLTLYNDYDQDDETRLFIMSNIINWSYDDRTYPVFQNIYKNFYESIEWDKLKEMSAYVHLKYITASTETLCRKIDDKDTPNYMALIKNHLDELREKYKDLIDKDILYYEYLEVFSHCITLMTDEMSSDERAYEALNSTSIDEDLFNIQYGDYSIAKISILNTKFELAFACRDFSAACRYFDLLVKYTNLGLSNIEKLLNGLMIYDKVMIEMYAASVRRILKVLPNLDTEYSLSNLNVIDKEFVLSEETDILKAAKSEEPSYYALVKTLKHYDDWFNNNDYTLDLFYNYYNNEYQEEQTDPNFDLEGILTATVKDYDTDGTISEKHFSVYPLGVPDKNSSTETDEDNSEEKE